MLPVQNNLDSSGRLQSGNRRAVSMDPALIGVYLCNALGWIGWLLQIANAAVIRSGLLEQCTGDPAKRWGASSGGRPRGLNDTEAVRENTRDLQCANSSL